MKKVGDFMSQWIVLGGIVAIVLLVAVILIIVQKRKQKKAKQLEMDEHELDWEDNLLGDHVINYNELVLTARQYFFIALIACGFFFIIGIIFYKSTITAFIFSLVGFLYPKLHRKKMLSKRKRELSQQFQQALFSLSSSLVAGRSIENAFLEVTKDLYLLYPDPDTHIIKEFELINRRLENRETIEYALTDFSQRAGIDDITSFTDVFVTCKRTGGDLVEVIRRTSTLISQKLEVEQDIAVMVSQKKFESNAISMAPIIIVAALSYTAEDYMMPLYRWSDLGPIIMTICLLIIGFSFWISQKIMDIKV